MQALDACRFPVQHLRVGGEGILVSAGLLVRLPESPQGEGVGRVGPDHLLEAFNRVGVTPEPHEDLTPPLPGSPVLRAGLDDAVGTLQRLFIPSHMHKSALEGVPCLGVTLIALEHQRVLPDCVAKFPAPLECHAERHSRIPVVGGVLQIGRIRFARLFVPADGFQHIRPDLYDRRIRGVGGEHPVAACNRLLVPAELCERGGKRKTGTGIFRPPVGHLCITPGGIRVLPHPLKCPAPVKPRKEVARVGRDGLPEEFGSLLIPAERGEDDPEVHQVSPGVRVCCKEGFVAVSRRSVAPEVLEDPCLPGKYPGIPGICLRHPVDGLERLRIPPEAFERRALAEQGDPVSRVSPKCLVIAGERLPVLAKVHERVSSAPLGCRISGVDIEEGTERLRRLRIPGEVHQGISLPMQEMEVVSTGVLNPVKRCQRVAVPAKVHEDVRLHRTGYGVMRLFLKNRVQAAVCLVIPAKVDECGATLQPRGDVSGVGLEDVLEVLLRLRVPPQVEQRNSPAVQDDIILGIELQGFRLPGISCLFSLEERKVGAAPDPLHPGHCPVLKHTVERPDRLGVLAEVEERHAAGVPHVDLTLVVLQDMIEVLDRPVVAAERIVDQAHGIAHRYMVRVGKGDLIEAVHRLHISSRPEEERAAVVQNREVPRIGGCDIPVTAGGVQEPAEVLERPGLAVECVEVAGFYIEHPAKRLDGSGVISLIQEGGPYSRKRIGAAGIHPVDPLKAGRRFPEVTGSLEHSPESLPQDSILRISVQRSCVGCRRIGIPVEPLKHLSLPVRGVRIRGVCFNDPLETSGGLLITAGPGESVPQSSQYLGIAGRRLESLPEPLCGFAVPAETGERQAHGESDWAVFRVDLERFLETLHRLAVVPGLKLRGSLLYQGVRILPLSKNITEEIHPPPSAAKLYNM